MTLRGRFPPKGRKGQDGLTVGPLRAAGDLTIGTVRVHGRAILAPMAGVTDSGMRRAALRFGAALTVSEMVAATSYAAGQPEARLRAAGHGIAVPAVQIAGCEPGPMAEAARQVEGGGAAVIDINMGCPAKRVTGGLSGSALMRDLDHACRLIAAVLGAVQVPVTVKMRLGWDAGSINAPLLAQRAEALGVGLVTVHGRTRQQFYDGDADWAAVRAVKAALRTIPLVVNGDCRSPADALAMLEASGADAVMVGRAAVGQPWIVGAVGAALDGRSFAWPSAAERLEAAVEHVETMLAALGPDKGLRHARKHLAAYAEHAGPASPARDALRRRLVTTTEPRDVAPLLRQAFFADPTPRAEAA